MSETPTYRDPILWRRVASSAGEDFSVIYVSLCGRFRREEVWLPDEDTGITGITVQFFIQPPEAAESYGANPVPR